MFGFMGYGGPRVVDDLTKPYKVRRDTPKGDVVASFDTLLQAMDAAEAKHVRSTALYYITTPDYKTWQLVTGGFSYSWKKIETAA